MNRSKSKPIINLPFIIPRKFHSRLKNKGKSIDMRNSIAALQRDYLNEKKNIFLSATPYHQNSNLPKNPEKQTIKEGDNIEKILENDIHQEMAKEQLEDQEKKLASLRGKIPPKALANWDSEIVEKLDQWIYKKGISLSKEPAIEKNKPDADEKESTFKTQFRKFGYSRNSSVSLNAIASLANPQSRPSLLLVGAKVKLPNLFPSGTSKHPEICQETVIKEQDELLTTKYPGYSGYYTEKEDGIKETQIIPNITNAITKDSQKHVEIEYKMTYKFHKLNKDFEKLKKKEKMLVAEKNSVLISIKEAKEQIRASKFLNRKQHSIPVNKIPEEGSTTERVETGRHQMKERNTQLTSKIEELRKEVEELTNELEEIKEKKIYSKSEIEKLRDIQNEYYHELLSKGTDIRQDGLGWIIKAIWLLGCNITISKLPGYLDEKAVTYLLNFTRLEFDIDKLKKKLSEQEKEESKAIDNDSPLKEIRQIQKDQKEIRKKEWARLMNDFKLKNYGLKYNVTLEKLTSALFGCDYMKKKLDKAKEKEKKRISGSVMRSGKESQN